MKPFQFLFSISRLPGFARVTSHESLCSLLVAADLVEEWLTGSEARLRAVVHGIRSLFACLVPVAPERSRAVRAVFIDGVEIDVERAEFFLIVFLVVRDAAERFQAGVRG